MTKRETAGLIVEKRNGALRPVSSFDAEQMAGHPDGAEFDVVARRRRSNPQNRLYWQTLSNVLAATALGDRYPTSTHLHDALLRDLGYVYVTYNLDGTPHLTRDSTAFDAMRPEPFRVYFDAAMARLAEITGVDPLQATEAA